MLLELTAEQMEKLVNVLHSRETLQSDDAPYVQAAREAGLDSYEAISVLTAISNLAKQCDRRDISIEHAISELGEKLEVPIDEDRREALQKLLSPSDEGYVIENAQRLKLAFLPHLVRAKTVCDVRPVFDRDHESVEGALAVVLLELSLHDSKHDEESVVIQLDRDDVRELKTVLEDAERKLDLINESFSGTVEFFS